MNIIEKLSAYLSFSFVRYAIIAGVLIALCSSLIGVSLVLKRYSMIGDGLSHVAFGAMAIASALSLAPMAVAMPMTIVAAVFLLRFKGKFKGDTSIALISVSALAIGYLILNIFPSSSNTATDVCTTLFGSTSILTLTAGEVWLCAGLCVGVAVFFTIFYNKIFSITFDEEFSRASGTPTAIYDTAFAIIIAVVIVLSMSLVGALLVSALIIFPAVSAMQIFRSFKQVTVCSVIISVFCALLGLFIAILYGTPVGSTIVAANLILLAVFTLIGKIRRHS